MKLLIGFSGSMGSGKSTAIDALRAHGIGAVAIAKFAAPLYQIQQMVYRVISPVYTPPADFVKDRRLLQLIGFEWGREIIGPSLWVDLWTKAVTLYAQRDPDLIIACDDIRFDNEVDAVHALDGVVVHIQSHRGAEAVVVGTGSTDHASEDGVSMEKVDYVVENNGTEEDFKDSLRVLFAQIMSDQGIYSLQTTNHIGSTK